LAKSCGETGASIFDLAILGARNRFVAFSQKTRFPIFAHAKFPQIDLDDGNNTPSPAPNYSTINNTTNTIQ
jgi:hypothetical protein